MNIEMDTLDIPNDDLTRLAVFGSGTGSNAEAIIEWSNDATNQSPFTIVLIVSTSYEAGINALGAKHDIPVVVVPRSLDAQAQTNVVCEALRTYRVDLIALAGYLRMIPSEVIQTVKGHLLNIHPSLLPAYGGKGMYGMAVHEAVLAAREAVTGATVHLVNERYDDGHILAQQDVHVLPNDDAQSLARRVLEVEHRLYPRTIAAYVRELRANRMHQGSKP